MATNIDYASDYENPSATIFHGMNDYGGEASDCQTTIAENPSATIDYKACPLLLLTWLSLPINPKKKDKMLRDIECARKFCAWWDADKERCAVLSMARNK